MSQFSSINLNMVLHIVTNGMIKIYKKSQSYIQYAGIFIQIYAFYFLLPLLRSLLFHLTHVVF